MKQYIDVIWKHQNLCDPIRLVLELGDDRFELRKLEFFLDGTVDASDGDHETSRTRLGLAAVPSLDEINQDTQFEASAMTRGAFESLWAQHALPATR